MQMDFLTLLIFLNYGLVLFFGFFLSVSISGGCQTIGQKRIAFLFCLIVLVIQSICCLIFGVQITEQLYPFIVHLPIMLILIFLLKKRIDIACVSVFTAYLCCQLPRFVNLISSALTGSDLAGEISYTISIFIIYYILRRFFVNVANRTFTHSKQSFLLFASLPIIYYIFDYSTVVYSDLLYKGIPFLTEFFPTAFIIFYLIIITIYHTQTQEKFKSELQKAILEMEIKEAIQEIESLKHIEFQTAVYNHDMRHNLNTIAAYINEGQLEKAVSYIRSVHNGIERLTPKHFCDNSLANLVLSSFLKKAENSKIEFIIKAEIPKDIPISEAQFTTLISNGLENAFNAVHDLDDSMKKVEFYSTITMNKLLIEIKNPFSGDIIIEDNLPKNTGKRKGYGCLSIKSVVEDNNGICSFDVADGIFRLRIVLPIANGVNGTAPKFE